MRPRAVSKGRLHLEKRGRFGRGLRIKGKQKAFGRGNFINGRHRGARNRKGDGGGFVPVALRDRGGEGRRGREEQCLRVLGEKAQYEASARGGEGTDAEPDGARAFAGAGGRGGEFVKEGGEELGVGEGGVGRQGRLGGGETAKDGLEGVGKERKEHDQEPGEVVARFERCDQRAEKGRGDQCEAHIQDALHAGAPSVGCGR